MRADNIDAVSSLRTSGAVEGGVKVVSGRIKLPNVYGSERLALPMTATVQYYNGSSWVTSTNDSASIIAVGSQTIVKGPLALGNLTQVESADACATAAVFCNGLKTIIWTSANVAGSVDIVLNAPTYLPSNTARATFGIFKSPLIYRRENY